MFPKILRNAVCACLLLIVLAATASHTLAAQCRLYATDYNTDTVRAMDCTNNANTVMQPIPVGQQPFGIVASADGKWLYVANYGSDSVTVINTDFNIPYYSVGVGDGPIGVAISADGRRLYVANYLGDSVSVVNIPSNGTTPTLAGTIAFPSGSQPDNVALSADGSVLYVARWHDYKVSAVDLSTPNYQIVQTLVTGGAPSAFAVSADGKRVYVANEFGGPNADGSIAVLDSTNPRQNTILTTWNLPYHTFPQQQIALSSNGRYLYVPAEGSAAALMIDTDDGSVKSSFRAGVQPWSEALSPDGALVYVAHGNEIAILNSGWNTTAFPDVTLGGPTSWLLNMAVVHKTTCQ
jgi:YVTN family beta-propeller protein